MNPEHSDTAIVTSRIVSYETYKDFVNDVICIICTSLPKVPQQCKGCEKIACLECLHTWNKPDQCPQNCENPGYTKPSKMTMRIMDNLTILCKNKDNGCQAELKLCELKEHETACEYRIVECPVYAECNTKVILKDLAEHEMQCEFIKQSCHFCGITVPRKYFAQHEEGCLEKTLSCEDCGENFEKREKEKHDAECTDKVIECEECGMEDKRKIMQMHSCVKYLKNVLKENISEKNLLKKEVDDIKLKFNEFTILFNEVVVKNKIMARGGSELRYGRCTTCELNVLIFKPIPDFLTGKFVYENKEYDDESERCVICTNIVLPKDDNLINFA